MPTGTLPFISSNVTIGPTPSPTVWTLSGMTAETIAFREKCFIGAHWIISFMIFAVIPIVYFMNRAEKRAKERRRLEFEMESQQTPSFHSKSKQKIPKHKTLRIVIEKKNHIPNHSTDTVELQTNLTGSEAEDVETPDSPDTKNIDFNTKHLNNKNNNKQLNVIGHGEKLNMKEKSKSKSHSRSHSKSRSITKNKKMKEEKGERRNNYFKIVSAICVFLWWSRVVTAACSMMIWHYDYIIAEHIAFEWDLLRSLIYHTSKLLMYLMYMTRIYQTFHESKYQYSIWFIILLYVLVLSDYIIKLIVYLMLNEQTAGYLEDKKGANDFLNGAFIYLVVEEFIIMLLMIIAFIKPLIVMSMNIMSIDILQIISKYTILGLLAIISSFTLSLFRLIYIGSFDLLLIWMTAIWVSIDCLINTWCTVLLFNFAKPTYIMLCGCCDKKLVECVEKITKRRSTEVV